MANIFFLILLAKHCRYAQRFAKKNALHCKLDYLPEHKSMLIEMYA